MNPNGIMVFTDGESESVWKEVERGSDVRGVQAVYVQREKGLRLIRDGDDATME